MARLEADLQVAAVAIANNPTLISGNILHYAGLPGLRVENWIA